MARGKAHWPAIGVGVTVFGVGVASIAMQWQAHVASVQPGESHQPMVGWFSGLGAVLVVTGLAITLAASGVRVPLPVSPVVLERDQRGPLIRFQAPWSQRDRVGAPIEITDVTTVAHAPEDLTPRPDQGYPPGFTRTFVGLGVTPDYLVGLFENHTTADAQALVEGLRGCIKLRGALADRTAWTDPGGSQFTFRRPVGKPALLMKIRDRASHDKVARLVPGDALTIFGEISTVTANGLMLDHCEVTDTSGAG